MFEDMKRRVMLSRDPKVERNNVVQIDGLGFKKVLRAMCGAYP